MVTLLAAFLNPLLMIAMPILLGTWLAKRLGAEWRPFGLGMLAFVGSQVLHLPFNAWLLSPLVQRLGLQAEPDTAGLAIVAGLLGLSAGVFEESARYLVYRQWLPRARSWRDGLMFGAGHGGIEAILLGLISFYSFLQLFALRGAHLPEVLSPDQIGPTRSALEAYWSLPYYQHLIPALERACALCIHLSLSLLVLQVFTLGDRSWLFLAILWHALVNTAAVFALQTWGVYAAEGIVVTSALLSLGIILRLRGRWVEESGAHTQPSPQIQPPRLEPVAENLDSEKLENTRYDYIA